MLSKNSTGNATTGFPVVDRLNPWFDGVSGFEVGEDEDSGHLVLSKKNAVLDGSGIG